MGFNLLLRSEVEEDLEQAIGWYESKSPGLGKRFFTSFEETLSKIMQHPEHYRYITKPVRRCVISKFPYAIHYLQTDNTILVLGVIHRNRSNAFKKKRFRQR